MYVTRAAFAQRPPMQGLGRLRRPRRMGALNPISNWQRRGLLPSIPSVVPIISTLAPTTTTSPTRTTTPWQRRQWTQGQQAQQTQQGASWWQRLQQKNAVNTSGQPDAVQSYDAAGNPVYSVPPPGQSIIGYDNYGNPLYATGAAAAAAGGTIIGYDANGNPIYSANAANASFQNVGGRRRRAGRRGHLDRYKRLPVEFLTGWAKAP